MQPSSKKHLSLNSSENNQIKQVTENRNNIHDVCIIILWGAIDLNRSDLEHVECSV